MIKQTKYGIYDFHGGQDCFLLSDKKYYNEEVLENVTINDDNGILEVTAIKTYYRHFYYYGMGYYWWNDSWLKDYDLDGRTVEDVTVKKYKNIFHLIIGKKSRRLKDSVWLKIKNKTGQLNMKTSCWSINMK
jgi:hypothetical protein